jgi:hypothetical protein
MLTNHSTTVSAIIIAAIAFGVIVVVDMVVFPILEAQARGCESGFPNSEIGVNASKGRCFGH